MCQVGLSTNSSSISSYCWLCFPEVSWQRFKKFFLKDKNFGVKHFISSMSLGSTSCTFISFIKSFLICVFLVRDSISSDFPGIASFCSAIVNFKEKSPSDLASFFLSLNSSSSLAFVSSFSCSAVLSEFPNPELGQRVYNCLKILLFLQSIDLLFFLQPLKFCLALLSLYDLEFFQAQCSLHFFAVSPPQPLHGQKRQHRLQCLH